MINIVLNGQNMTTIQSAHEEVARALELPSYYGKNLDALWDVLSSLHEETEIKLIHADTMLNILEGYGARMLQVFYDASSEYGHIEFIVSPIA